MFKRKAALSDSASREHRRRPGQALEEEDSLRLTTSSSEDGLVGAPLAAAATTDGAVLQEKELERVSDVDDDDGGQWEAKRPVSASSLPSFSALARPRKTARVEGVLSSSPSSTAAALPSSVDPTLLVIPSARSALPDLSAHSHQHTRFAPKHQPSFPPLPSSSSSSSQSTSSPSSSPPLSLPSTAVQPSLRLNSAPLSSTSARFGPQKASGYARAISRVDYQPDVCVAAGTAVTLSNGSSKAIETVVAGDSVLSFERARNGLVPMRVSSAAKCTGLQECIELLFSDATVLTVTADHRILTDAQQWVRAGDLIVGQSHVSAGMQYPLQVCEEVVPPPSASSCAWRLDCKRTLGRTVSVAEAAVFARLMGYLLTGCTVYEKVAGHTAATLYSAHRLDVEAMQGDIQLLTGKRVSAKRSAGTWTLTLPRELSDAYAQVGVHLGKRVGLVTRFPLLLTSSACPVSVVRAFLGALFGGDGHTIALSRARRCFTVESSLIKLSMHRLGCVARQQVEQLQSELYALLERCGVSTQGAAVKVIRSAPSTITERYRKLCTQIVEDGEQLTQVMADDEQLQPTQSYALVVQLAPESRLSFFQHVSFQYCCHKQMRLTAIAAYLRQRHYLVEQHQRVAARALAIMQVANPTRKRVGLIRVVAAVQQAKQEETLPLHPLVAAWLPRQQKQLRRSLPLSRHSSDSGTLILDAACTVLRVAHFFSSRKGSQRKRKAEGILLEDETSANPSASTPSPCPPPPSSSSFLPHPPRATSPALPPASPTAVPPPTSSLSPSTSTAVQSNAPSSSAPPSSSFSSTCSPHRQAGAEALPMFRVRLLAVREVGQRLVYDLSVPQPQQDDQHDDGSFVAAGVVVHNCKDWMECGSCGYGDSCKFLHDRLDYQQGWQMDKEWSDRKAKEERERKEGKTEGELLDVAARKRALPFACFLCRRPFTRPVVTSCGHHFDEACALARFRKTTRCPVCGKETNGSLQTATDILTAQSAVSGEGDDAEQDDLVPHAHPVGAG